MTRILINAREDIKYSPRAIILLIGLQIVDIKQLDDYLAKVSLPTHPFTLYMYAVPFFLPSLLPFSFPPSLPLSLSPSLPLSPFQSIESGRNLAALSCCIKLVNAIVSAEKRDTPITDVRPILAL